jgi:ribosome modulation factor
MADTQHVDPHKAIIANGITVAIVPDKEHPDYREEERISPSSATPDGYVDSRGNTNPYLQGEEAWFEGKRCDESPYEAATDNDEDWRAGWRNAAEAYT